MPTSRTLLSYALFPGSPLFNAYSEARVLHPSKSLAELMDRLEPLPLKFQPGTDWEYSVSIDVLSRLVEVVSEQTFGKFLHERIFAPLEMVDTGFVVAPEKQHLLTAYYAGADVMNPLKPGLTRADDMPWPNAYREPVALQSGGGGLVSSLPDTIAFIRAPCPAGRRCSRRRRLH